MAKGTKKSNDITTIEAEIQALREKQLQLRQQLRRLKNSGQEITKLEARLEKQIGYSKWTIEQIKALDNDWDEIAFANRVAPRKPARRGRLPRTPLALAALDED